MNAIWDLTAEYLARRISQKEHARARKKDSLGPCGYHQQRTVKLKSGELVKVQGQMAAGRRII